MDLSQRAWNIHERLLDFYGYPEWRNPLPPLDELISTILSQNTNDKNRDHAFKALQAQFSSWEAVRDADKDLVIDTIRSAGLANQKGPRIQNLLRQITAERGELDLSFLNDLSTKKASDWLLKFKGVGPKTAAIVLQFSLAKPAFPVDTHIYRITGRVGLLPAKISTEKAHHYLQKLFPPETYFPVHLNLIRLGREICLARRLDCPSCPLKEVCDFYAAKPAHCSDTLSE